MADPKNKVFFFFQVRATKIIFTIILMFIICWLPNEVSITVYSLEDLGAISEWSMNIVQILIIRLFEANYPANRKRFQGSC